MDLLFIGGVTVGEQSESENPISKARKTLTFCINPSHVVNFTIQFARFVLVLKDPVAKYTRSISKEVIKDQIVNICVPKGKQAWWKLFNVATALLSPSEKIFTDEEAETIQAICTQASILFFFIESLVSFTGDSGVGAMHLVSQRVAALQDYLKQKSLKDMLNMTCSLMRASVNIIYYSLKSSLINGLIALKIIQGIIKLGCPDEPDPGVEEKGPGTEENKEMLKQLSDKQDQMLEELQKLKENMNVGKDKQDEMSETVDELKDKQQEVLETVYTIENKVDNRRSLMERIRQSMLNGGPLDDSLLQILGIINVGVPMLKPLWKPLLTLWGQGNNMALESQMFTEPGVAGPLVVSEEEQDKFMELEVIWLKIRSIIDSKAMGNITSTT